MAVSSWGVAWTVLAGLAAGAAAEPVSVVRYLRCDKPLTRVGRTARVTAMLSNETEAAVDLRAVLSLPQSFSLEGGSVPAQSVRLAPAEQREVSWTIGAREPAYDRLGLRVTTADGDELARADVTMRFLPALAASRPEYLPPPQPVKTSLLIGAHHCPLWEADKPQMWSQLHIHPERTPALGFYAQENPEIADWETKWAVEHGVSFFIYCWYRTSQGGPVTTMFSSAIHDALFKSRYADQLKFTIMWENQSRGRAGVANEQDLLGNLLPYWIENYFKYPGYLKIDNKPVLFIYRPEFLIQDLGGLANVGQAFAKMRQACRDAGFDGLYLMGEYRGTDPKHLTLLKQLGLDYTFAYCWHVQNSPPPDQVIAAQQGYLTRTQELNILPQVPTVSQAWSGWRDEGSIWKLPPDDWERLLRWAKGFCAKLPESSLGRRMLLLDNWNEWGEGHYIAPYREYGFGYLDAVRKVFSDAPEAHQDLIPEDIGRGPYDRAYWAALREEEEFRRQVRRQVVKPGAPAGLVGWWSFDEPADSLVALDWSGHRLGGVLRQAKRAAGKDGLALVCDGGCVQVAASDLLAPAKGLTFECWVKTDQAGQNDRWFVNRIYSGHLDTGYRFGLAGGRVSFAIPLTDWSHHLVAAEPLPVGRWVHLAGTYDGQMMRVYQDGREVGHLARTGPVKPNPEPLCLGNYARDHRAHFQGLLDEVRLYDRALTADEVAAHARG